jgi:hypothetical protein
MGEDGGENKDCKLDVLNMERGLPYPDLLFPTVNIFV